MVFNDDQRAYMRYLGSLRRDLKCFCGWHRKGECPNDWCRRVAREEFGDR